MELLKKYLGSGKIYKHTETSVVELRISKFTIISTIIIPLFEKNKLHGLKLLNFLDFCKVTKMMSEGKHLTIEGLILIQKIKSGMNKGRKFKNI
jgi:LAGLIDADG endonuclease